MLYHWLRGQGWCAKAPKSGEVFMKKAQTKTDQTDKKVIVELSEKDLAAVAGGVKRDRRIIVYQ
jgi:ribosomal protein S25